MASTHRPSHFLPQRESCVPETLTCLQGHQWQHTPGDTVGGNTPITCPVCGCAVAAGAGPAAGAAGPWVNVAPGQPSTPSGSTAEVASTLIKPGHRTGQPSTPVSGPPGSQPDPADRPPSSSGTQTRAATIIAGHEVLGLLGRGAMGVVYKARQLSLNRLVALKMVLAGRHAGPQERSRLLAEAEAVAALQHPNIVQVYDVGEHDDLPFFSMEIVDGGSLADRARGAPFPARQAAGLVEKLARAVHYAHQNGVVHRDLKPANVLLTQDGEPKVTDFGLAKRGTRPTRRGGGTPPRRGRCWGRPATWRRSRRRARASAPARRRTCTRWGRSSTTS